MKHDVDASRGLEFGLLRLYKRAVIDGRPEIAEHMLCALEDLAKSDPTSRPALDQAYLDMRGSPGIKPHGPLSVRKPVGMRRRP